MYIQVLMVGFCENIAQKGMRCLTLSAKQTDPWNSCKLLGVYLKSSANIHTYPHINRLCVQYTQMLHVWYIYQHLGNFVAKCW